MDKMDLALNNLQRLIYHKNKSNQTIKYRRWTINIKKHLNRQISSES